MALNGKIRSLLGAAWTKVVYYFNFVVDPPPAAIKWYVLGVVVVALGGGIIGARLNRPHIAENRPFGLISPREVITSVPPAPAAVQALPPLEKTIKAADVTPTKKRKPKPKPKCDAVFC